MRCLHFNNEASSSKRFNGELTFFKFVNDNNLHGIAEVLKDNFNGESTFFTFVNEYNLHGIAKLLNDISWIESLPPHASFG
jgi:hypothetical protein